MIRLPMPPPTTTASLTFSSNCVSLLAVLFSRSIILCVCVRRAGCVCVRVPKQFCCVLSRFRPCDKIAVRFRLSARRNVVRDPRPENRQAFVHLFPFCNLRIFDYSSYVYIWIFADVLFVQSHRAKCWDVESSGCAVLFFVD